MNGITIYSASGAILYEMPTIYSGCKEKVTLMSEDYIELHFSLAEPIYFDVGSWCFWNDKKYYITSHQQPTPNINTGGYDYELKFDAYYIAWKLRIYKAKIQNIQETKFNYTGNVKTHLQFFVERLKDENLLYNDAQEYTFDIETYRNKDKDILDEVKTLSFSDNNFIDVLNQIASEWDTEWWVRKDKIYIGKCQEKDETSVDFELYKNVADISSSKSEQNYATRLYAFGSTKNLPHNWNKGNAEFVVSSVDSKNKTFKSEQELNSSYFNLKYIHKTYDYTTATVQRESTSVDTQSSGSEKIVVINANTKEIALPHAIYQISKNDNRRIYPIKDNQIQDTFSFVVKGTKNQYYILGYIRISYNISYSAKKKDGTYVYGYLAEGKTEYHKIQSLWNGGITIQSSLNSFELDKDVTNYVIRVQVSNVIFTNRTDETETTLLYKGTMSIENDTSIQFRVSDYYYLIDAKLAFLQDNGSEKEEQNAIFKTQGFDFRFNDSKTALPLVGTKFHIKNILNSKLPSSYFPSNRQEGVIKAMAEARLSLPEGYIQSDDSQSIVERVVTYDDIYPSVKTPITDILTEEKNILADDGITTTDETYTQYSIKQDKYVFKNEYKLPDAEQLQIMFQSGRLAGLTFNVEYNEKYKWFKIERTQFDGGLYLPNDALYPEKGDEFILINWDSSRLEELGLIAEAQQRLEQRATEELKDMITEPSSYTCTLYSDIAFGIRPNLTITDNNGSNILIDDNERIILDDTIYHSQEYKWDFTLGQRVKLINKAFFKKGYRDSRIMGYEKNMDIPYDSPQYTIGSKAKYSKFKDLQTQINKK